MTDEETVHRYAMLGLTAYIEHKLQRFKDEKMMEPQLVIVGRLEWVVVMGCTDTDEWSVAGVPVAPNLSYDRYCEVA